MTNCKKADVFDFESRGADEDIDMDHIHDCEECSQLLDGHRKLALAFQGTQRSAPSIHFNRDLRIRLRDVEKCKQCVRRRDITLRAYWLLATAASLVTLWMIPWSSQALPAPVAWTIGTIMTVAAVVPIMILRSSLEISRKLVG